MSFRKFVCLLILACMLTAVFTACGEVTKPNGNGNTVDISTPAPNTTSSSDVTSQPVTEPVDTADPNLTPAPTAVPELPAGQLLWLNTMSTDLYGVTLSDAEAWFSDAVFVGDSIMLGWKNYNDTMLMASPNFFGPTHFLCEGSYGAGHALEPVSADCLHPVYMGERRLLWDSISMMEANKVFICFGLNDIAIYGVDGTIANFNTLIDNIENARDGVDVYIISAMYMYEGSEMTTLNNTNIRLLNAGLRSMCETRGLHFVDIASHLVNEAGFTLAEYSSDQYVHQTIAAYNIWADILRSIAAHDIKWGY